MLNAALMLATVFFSPGPQHSRRRTMQLPSANTEGAISPIRSSTQAFIDRMIEQPALLRADEEQGNLSFFGHAGNWKSGKSQRFQIGALSPIPIARSKPES